jgi:DNA-binding CsgD family transcriptional regulator
MPALLSFIAATRRIKTVEALFEFFTETMTGLGYDLMNFSIISAYDIAEHHMGFGLINTYPLSWQRYYDTHNCRQIDPVAQCATSTFRPFHWHELERLMPLSPRQRRFLREAQAAGLHHGVGIPFKGPMSQVAGIALATSDPHAKDLPSLDVLVAYCNQFFEVFRSFVTKPARPPRGQVLSLRERQVLEGVGRSLYDAEIADILGIKSSTVDSHLRHAFTKLKVKTRTGAVLTAMKMGLIDP